MVGTHALYRAKWGKKSHAVESSTWPLNSHNCSENYPKTKTKTKCHHMTHSTVTSTPHYVLMTHIGTCWPMTHIGTCSTAPQHHSISTELIHFTITTPTQTSCTAPPLHHHKTHSLHNHYTITKLMHCTTTTPSHNSCTAPPQHHHITHALHRTTPTQNSCIAPPLHHHITHALHHHYTIAQFIQHFTNVPTHPWKGH